MTRDDIIRIAREADAEHDDVRVTPFLERFASLVAAAEREDILRKSTKGHTVHGHCDIVLSADIRARSTP